MGNLRFAMSMLVKEYKKSIFYCLTMTFTITVSFMFFNIINNKFLADQRISAGGGTWSSMQVPFSTVLSFLIICFCCFMIFFANNFFISRKTSEIAIMAMGGNSSGHSTMYLVYQTTMLLLIATPLGLGLGTLVTSLSNYWMYHYLHVYESIYDIPINAYTQTLVLIGMILVVLCVFAGGYIYRNDISSLLQQEQAMDFNDKRHLKMPSVIYIGIYLFGIVMMFMQEHGSTAYVAPTFIGILGAIGIIRYWLPDFSKKFKDSKLLTKRYALIYVSNLSYSIRRSVILVGLMTASVTGMLAAIASNQKAPREYITGIIGYIVIVVLLVTSIVYKFSMEAQTRKTLFYNMWKIGYTKKELARIVKMEIFYYYLILLMIPMVYILFMAGRFIYYGDMQVSFCMIVVAVYLVPIIVSGLVTYFNYRNAVVKPIEGGK